jgi:hypothetical protein
MTDYTGNRDLIRTISGSDINLIGFFVKSCFARDEKINNWIKSLKERGVTMAHPDDGWVDRSKDTISPCYPYFDNGVYVGSVIALGNPENYRLVRVIAKTHKVLISDWYVYAFEEIKPPKTRSFIDVLFGMNR